MDDSIGVMMDDVVVNFSMPSNTKPFILLSMKVSILSIGNELLSGKTKNTNANWLGNRLTKIGCEVDKQVVVPDKEKPIINALNFLANDKEGWSS